MGKQLNKKLCPLKLDTQHPNSPSTHGGRARPRQSHLSNSKVNTSSFFSGLSISPSSAPLKSASSLTPLPNSRKPAAKSSVAQSTQHSSMKSTPRSLETRVVSVK